MAERGKIIEVDETAFLANQKVVETVQRMLANPKARRKVLEAQKDTFPDTVIPEIDAALPYAEELQATKKDLAELRDSLKKKEEEAAANAAKKGFADKWEAGKRALREAGYSDEGIAAIEKMAEERGIPDLEAAEALFARLHPPAEVVNPSGFGSWNFFEPPPDENADAKDIKALMDSRGEDEMAIRRLTNRALADVRGQQPRR